MTKSVAIIGLLFSTLTFGQIPKDKIPSKDAYNSVNGLTLVDSVSWEDIVGGFYISDGFNGYNFRLDSNMTFQKIDFGCIARFKVDSGTWAIQNRNTAILKSSKQTLYFDIVKFANFYFFIPPLQRQIFVDDINSARLKYQNAKPFTISTNTYSVDYIIGYSLMKKYYTKEIEEITGT